MEKSLAIQQVIIHSTFTRFSDHQPDDLAPYEACQDPPRTRIATCNGQEALEDIEDDGYRRVKLMASTSMIHFYWNPTHSRMKGTLGAQQKMAWALPAPEIPEDRLSLNCGIKQMTSQKVVICKAVWNGQAS